MFVRLLAPFENHTFSSDQEGREKGLSLYSGKKLESLRQESRHKFLTGHADEVINLKPKSRETASSLK